MMIINDNVENKKNREKNHNINNNIKIISRRKRRKGQQIIIKINGISRSKFSL